jgi:uncharacterized protein YegP (UPF0339 family)
MHKRLIVGNGISQTIYPLQPVRICGMNKPEYYKDGKGEWRWRVMAANFKVIDASSESFSSKQAAENNYGLNHDVSSSP